MIINKTELKQALEIVKPGLSNKDIIEQATSFAFIEGNVVTFNNEISICHPVGGLELSGAIKAEELYNLLSKLKDDEINIDVKDNEILLTSGKSKAGMVVQAEVKLPLEEIGKIENWLTLPSDFLKHLKFTIASCSKDMSRPTLTCVHINDEIIESSDGFRITRCTLEEMVPVPKFLLPASSAIQVVKLQPTEIASGNGWVHFKTEQGTVISCRTMEGEFPSTITDWLKTEGTTLTLPQTTSEVVEKSLVFSKRESVLDEKVDITIANRRLKIRSESETGWFEEELNIQYKGEPIIFSITPGLLKGILSETSECVIGDTKILFTGNNWVYLAMLMGK